MHGRHLTSRDATRGRAETEGGFAAVKAEPMEHLEGKKSRMATLV